MSNLNNKKIKICILEMSSQNKAILEFFFENSGKSLFEESSVDQADAYIVDYDYPAAKESAEEIHNQYKIPGIIISIKEVDHPDTVWIAKPLTIKALTSANKQISLIISELTESSKTSSKLDEPQNKLQIDKQKDISEKKSISLDQASFNNDLETQQSVKKEKIQASQANIHKEQVVNTPAPALAGFDDEPLLDDDLIFETDTNTNTNTNKANKATEKIIPEVIEEPAPDTDHKIDELLLELSESDVNAAFDNDVSSNIEVIENDSLEKFNLDPLPKNTDGVVDEIADEIADIKEKDTFSEMDEDNHLAHDLLDVVTKKDNGKQENISIEIDEGVSSDIVADQSNSESLFFDGNPENTSENDYFEPVHGDIDTLPTDNGVRDETDEIDSLSKEVEEVKAESILEQVNDQLNNDLLKSDTFSIDNNSEHEPSLSELSLDKQIAELDSLDTLIPEEAYAETSNNDVATVEDPIEENTLLEPDNANNPAQITQPAEASVKAPSLDEKVVSEENKASSDVIESELSAEEELQSLLEEIRQEAEGATLIRSDNGQGFTSQRHTPTFAEERWTKTCGESDPIESKHLPYMPENHMLSTLQKVIAKSKSTQKVMRLKFNGIIIVVMPELQMIYCDLSIYDSSYAGICYEPINQEDIKVHYLDTSEIRLYKKKISEGSELAHSFESFVWTTSLLTARGRLPHGTDTKKTVAIKYWPDLTRIETFPHIMQIAAVFYKHPGCLRDIPTWLGIEQRYVYAFYNGALSLGLMELDHKQLSLQAHKSGAFKKTNNRGFFSRLLKRIKT